MTRFLPLLTLLFFGLTGSAFATTSYRAVSTSFAHTCAITTEEQVKCWGLNGRWGLLGDGTKVSSRGPVLVKGLDKVTNLDAGTFRSCATISDGQIKCWGENKHGQLGDGTTNQPLTPVPVQGISDGAGIGVGVDHACLLTRAGLVRCWGDDVGSGRLGLGNPLSAPDDLDAPNEIVRRSVPTETVSGLATARQLDTGGEFSCALIDGGQVQCWGDNYAWGQLGDGSKKNSSTAVTVSGLSGALAISSGSGHSCALLEGGRVTCWGQTGLSDDGSDTHLTPALVADLAGIKAVSAGDFHSCAVLSDGQVRCWGANEHGQLGNGTRKSSSRPVTVVGINNAVSVSAGPDYSCAVLQTGELRCWGKNDRGQLGDGSYRERLRPVAVADGQKLSGRARLVGQPNPRLDRRYRLSVRIEGLPGNGPVCKGSVGLVADDGLRLNEVLVGQTRFRLGACRKGQVTITLNRRGRKYLKQGKGRLYVLVAVLDEAGGRVDSQGLVLRRAS